jgi:hypothetical protein
MPGGETGSRAELMAESLTGQPVQHLGDRTARPEMEKAVLAPRVLAPRVLASRFLVRLGIAAFVGVCLIGASGCQLSPSPDAFQELGAGISNVTGLKGHLKTRWQGKAAQYVLEIEPISLLQKAGFSYVMANHPGPLVLHMKLMDKAGYTVCGKDVLFPFDPSSKLGAGPGEADRERGQDLLQTTLGDDGKVDSLSTQGTLPCTPDQYKQVDYWDFSTNFPTVDQQDALRKSAAELKARQEAQKRAAVERQKAGPSDFYMVGDDQVAGYDASSKVLRTQLSRSFLVSGPGQQTASLWASNDASFRYKCDERSRCVLISGGGRQSLLVTALQ